MPKLSNNVVAIIGGAGILGRKISSRLIMEGARVAIIDLDIMNGRRLASDLGERAIFIDADISSEKSLQEACKKIELCWGYADVLINNVAIKSENIFAAFEEYPLEEWEEVIRVNTTGPMIACRVFGKRMVANNRGSIINTLSVYHALAPDQRIYEGALYEGRKIMSPAVYTVSKAGLWGLTIYLAALWAKKGVRVNAVSPGGIYSGQNSTFVAAYSNRVPLGRMASGDELPGAYVYLASDDSSYVTGQNMFVDGGLSIW